MTDDDKIRNVISTSGKLSFREMERARRFYTMILDEARSVPGFTELNEVMTIGEALSPEKLTELWEKSAAEFVGGPEGVSKTS